MKVRLTTARAGHLILDQEGDVIDVPDREAARLLASGQAERVDDGTVETAAVIPGETAARNPRPHTRRK